VEPTPPPDDTPYLRAALQAAHLARAWLTWWETAAERLAPERIAALANETQEAHGPAFAAITAALAAHPAPDTLAPFAATLQAGFDAAATAFALFAGAPTAAPVERIPRILGAMHHAAYAEECFYLLRQALPPFQGYWLLPEARAADLPSRPGSTEEPPTGVVHVGAGGHHGGFSLYVPETYAPDRAWPLIVALHGGSGNGRDFLWTWLREAKSLEYVLVAPTAVGDTWGAGDDEGILEILAWLVRRYRVARDRILLTGLSDGATFGLLYGLAHPEVYRAIAPLCGVLHPANWQLGNIARAAGKPIYLVHGAMDFLFPVASARAARDVLVEAGAALEYRELPELSHAYPRSENVRILEWFEGGVRSWGLGVLGS